MATLSTIDSNRLSSIRFPLIAGVVLIHNYDLYTSTISSATGYEWQANITFFIINFIANGIARLAVPIFFIISSYLFFIKYESSIPFYKASIQKKAKSLLTPFLFWNASLFTIVILLMAIPSGKNLFSDRIQIPTGINPADYLNSIIGINHKPIGHHFWFIRDLIILFLAAPIVHFLVARIGLLFITPITILWIFDAWPIAAPTLDSVLFFSIGCLIAIKKISLFRLDRQLQIYSFIYFPLLILSTILGESTAAGRITHNISIVIGIPVALGATFYTRNHKQLLALSSSSFFVYAAHDPAISVLRKLILSTVPYPNHLVVLSLYFIIPTVLVFLLIKIHGFLNLNLPRFTSTITGGR